jgi:hypothetical protein
MASHKKLAAGHSHIEEQHTDRGRSDWRNIYVFIAINLNINLKYAIAKSAT